MSHPLVTLMLAAGGLESIITVVIFLLLAGVNAWRQRQREREPGDSWDGSTGDPAQSPRPPTPSPMAKWEEELRRLLQESAPTPPPLPQSSPTPKPPAPPSPRPAFKSVLAPRQSSQRQPAPVEMEVEEGPEMQLPQLSKSGEAFRRASELQERVTSRLHKISENLGRMPESSRALSEASRLEAMTADHMKEGFASSSAAATVQHRSSLSPQAEVVLSLLRHPAGLRQAVLASLILAPPKALE